MVRWKTLKDTGKLEREKQGNKNGSGHSALAV